MIQWMDATALLYSILPAIFFVIALWKKWSHILILYFLCVAFRMPFGFNQPVLDYSSASNPFNIQLHSIISLALLLILCVKLVRDRVIMPIMLIIPSTLYLIVSTALTGFTNTFFLLFFQYQVEHYALLLLLGFYIMREFQENESARFFLLCCISVLNVYTVFNVILKLVGGILSPSLIFSFKIFTYPNTNSNSTAEMLVFFALICLLFIRDHSSRVKRIAVLNVAACIVFVIVQGERGSWLGLLPILIFLAVIHLRRNKLRKGHIIAGCLMAIAVLSCLVIYVAKTVLNSNVASFFIHNYDNFRHYYMDYALKLIGNNPLFGNGVGIVSPYSIQLLDGRAAAQFASSVDASSGTPAFESWSTWSTLSMNAHNIIGQFTEVYGVVGAALYFLPAAFVLVLAFAILRSAKLGGRAIVEPYYAALALVAMFTAFLINMFGFDIYPVFTLCVGLLLGKLFPVWQEKVVDRA
ncbi:MAG: O-antigen ligase family protein [Candidatus Ancillula sp.]|jgi:hypothetical protein|nr:O-antigen ligase family protein [Candidatus Ancillula sp.]